MEQKPKGKEMNNTKTTFFLCQICNKTVIAQNGIIDKFNICNNCNIWICYSHVNICNKCNESFCPNCIKDEMHTPKYAKTNYSLFKIFKCKLCMKECNDIAIKQEKE